MEAGHIIGCMLAYLYLLKCKMKLGGDCNFLNHNKLIYLTIFANVLANDHI